MSFFLPFVLEPRLILYTDEVCPGNQLRHEATCKVQIFYWGIKCAAGLSVDQLWFTLGLARSTIVNRLPGGMSGYVKKALQLFFEPFNVHQGIQLRVRNEVHIKFAKFGMFLADEVSLKEVFNFRGTSGILLCPLCLNIVNEASNLHEYSDGSLVPSSSCDMDKWVRVSNATILAKLRKLKASSGVVSKAAFEDLEKKLGWSYNPEGIMGDGSSDPMYGIRVVGMIQFDFMLVHGVWQIEVGGLVAQLKKECKIQQTQLHEFLSSFTWPSNSSSHSSTGRNIFRKKQQDVISCSASEGLGAYTVIRAFLAVNLASLSKITLEVQSYFALAKVLDALLALRKGTTSTVTLQRHSICEGHRRAWGSTLWVPKHHYLMRLPEMYTAQKVVAGCFIHERKHRVAKKFSENLRHVNDAFEVSILKEVLHVNLTDLQEKDIDQLHVGLVKPVVAVGALTALLQSLLGIDGK